MKLGQFVGGYLKNDAEYAVMKKGDDVPMYFESPSKIPARFLEMNIVEIDVDSYIECGDICIIVED